MHRPTTVMYAGPRAAPTSAARDQMLCPTPLAAICTVPNRAVMELSPTLASWNRPFSMELGTAMDSSRRIMGQSQVKIFPQPRDTRFFLEKHRAVMHRAAKIREMVEGQATPATPAWRTKMPMALPATLMAFIPRETFMVTLVLFMLRYRAAPALYRARAG